MTSWRAESDRWRKAHDALENELRSNRSLIDAVRAFLRKKELTDEFAEFLLAVHLGEAPAAELMKKCREERERNALTRT